MSDVRCEVRPLPQPEPPKEVVLTMPMETAKVLFALTGHVGGTGKTRKEVNALYEALHRAGVPNSPYEMRFTGPVYAKD